MKTEYNNDIAYDGEGDLSFLHATVWRSLLHGGWKCEVLTEMRDGSRAEAYTYGEMAPLTYKMANEIATRFVAGRKIPTRLEWR